MSKPQILAFDIECTHLRASFGHVICCSFLDVVASRAKPETFRIKTGKGYRTSDDKKLVAEIKEKLESAWMWLSWNGKMFDIPLLNGRLALHGLRPIEKRLHLDLMYYSRGQFMRLHSSRLDAIAKTFELKTQKTDILPAQWLAAGEGDEGAIDYVVRHCEADVKVLRDAFEILAPYVRNVHV